MGCGIVFGRNCAVQEHSLRTQSRQQSELSRRGVGCPVLASKPDCWLTPCREPRAHCSSPKATMFMKRRTVTSRAGSKTRGNAKLQVIETKPVTCSMVVADAFFCETAPKSDYIYENTSSYEKSVKKQGKAKSLKLNKLKSRGSAVRGKKMLKMQDDPTMSMKTQGRVTECRSRNHTFLIELAPALRSLWTVFEASGSNHLGEEGQRGTFAIRQSAAFCGPLKLARKRFL